MSEKDIEPNVSGLRYYLEAFYELSSCRAFGMTLGPIPFTAILEYSKIFNEEDFEEFLYLMRVMDREYMKLSSEDSKNKSKQKTGAKNGK